jgi:hypothetical protein
MDLWLPLLFLMVASPGDEIDIVTLGELSYISIRYPTVLRFPYLWFAWLCLRSMTLWISSGEAPLAWRLCMILGIFSGILNYEKGDKNFK